MLSRRQALAGTAALVFAPPARAETSIEAFLEDAARDLPPRDTASTADVYKAATDLLRRLRAIDPTNFSPKMKFEWRVARDGLERETEFARLAETGSAKARYAGLLALMLGKRVDPSHAHAEAEREIAALQSRADVLLRGQGLVRGSVAERLRALSADANFLYADNDEGRDKAVHDMNGWVSAIRVRLPQAFGALPMPDAEVRRMSRADEAQHRAGYRVLANSGGKAAYYVDLSQIRARPSWSLPSVVHHELLPGHVLQLTLQAVAHPPALRLRFAPVFSEAWAIYAEQLAAELGAFANAPLGELGYLQWRLFRMGRILADTGLHTRGWSIVRAVAVLGEIQGFSVGYTTIENDVAHMLALPGQVAAEGLGALEFARLRAGARKDLAAFHRAILENGPWPFDVLPSVLALGGVRNVGEAL